MVEKEKKEEESQYFFLVLKIFLFISLNDVFYKHLVYSVEKES